MRFLVILVCVTAITSAWPGPSAKAQDKAREIVPQARPVFVWLNAVKNGDQNQLKTAFSEQMRRRFDEEGWAKVLMTYQEVFRKEFGDYKVEDFGFEFTGGDASGVVTVVYRDKKLPGLGVIKESTDWKVNER